MSLKLDKENIYLILSNDKTNLNDKISDFMDGSFTISTRHKINKPEIYDMGLLHYIFARNGMHSGLGYHINYKYDVHIYFNYWFMDDKGKVFDKNIQYVLPQELEKEFNDYTVICDDENKKIKLYVNDDLKSEMDYSGSTKIKYNNTSIWLGCANMITDDELQKNISDAEIDFLLASNKALDLDEIKEVRLNYEFNYTETKTYDTLPILKYPENYIIFTDFKYKNRYKIWNMVDNGNFFQYYIEGNIYF
jgi:hypothetical protein